MRHQPRHRKPLIDFVHMSCKRQERTGREKVEQNWGPPRRPERRRRDHQVVMGVGAVRMICSFASPREATMLRALICTVVFVLTATAALAEPGNSSIQGMLAMHHQGDNPSGEGGP